MVMPLTFPAGPLLGLAIGVLLECAAAAERIPSGFGPFKVDYRGLSSCASSEKCFKPEKIDVANIRIIRDPNNWFKYTYNADINTTIPFDDGVKIDITVSKWNSLTSGWTNNVFRLSVPNVCSAFKARRPDVFQRVSEAMYDGTVTDCPIPPVNKRLQDFTIESKPPSNVKQLPYGRFKTKMKMYDKSQDCVLCYDAIADILPKNHH